VAGERWDRRPAETRLKNPQGQATNGLVVLIEEYIFYLVVYIQIQIVVK
jgi:hypothetical protein